MKKYKHLTYVFAALAVVLSDAMCAEVAYNYCTLLYGGRYAGYSAPVGTAFLLCIPYGIGILICAALAVFFHKKRQKSL